MNALRKAAVIAALAVSVAVYGQTPKTMESPRSFEVGGGYSMLHNTSGTTANGFSFGVQERVNRWASGVFDAGVYFRGGDTAVTYLGGPQVTYARYKAQPFARFLLGGGRDSANWFLLGGGWGVDYRVTRDVVLRPSVDYLRSKDGGNLIKVGVGISYRLSTH